MASDNQHHDIAELAALYTAGALLPDEAAEFEAKLAQGDADYVRELRRLSPAIETLADSASPVKPPAHVKENLLKRINDSRGQETEQPFYFQNNNESEWAGIGIPGASVRTLFIDRERKYKTFLLRMEPGCEIPAHPHPDAEECYIIEGDISTAGQILTAGDYMRAPAGTQHGRSFTRNGCLMLLTAGLNEHELN